MGRVTRFELVEIGLRAIRACRPLLGRVTRHDSNLADQLRRAITAAPLLAAEGNHARKGNRLAKLQAAKAEASEAETAVRVAIAFGYVSEKDAEAVLRDLSHFIAVARKLVS